MKTSLLQSIRNLLLITTFCVSATMSAFNKTNAPLSFEWDVLQKSSCESNNGILKISILGGHAPFKVVVDEYSHIYSRYANTADISNALFYNEADEHLVNDVFFQDEIILDYLPAGVKVISVTDVYGGDVSNMVDVPSSVMDISVKNENGSMLLEALFKSSSIPSKQTANLEQSNFYIELNKVDQLGSYSVKEIYEINKARSLESFMDLLNKNPDLNTNHRNVISKVFKRNIPYQFLTEKHILQENLEADKTYLLKIYPDESINGYKGVCMSYTYVFNTSIKSSQPTSNLVSINK